MITRPKGAGGVFTHPRGRIQGLGEDRTRGSIRQDCQQTDNRQWGSRSGGSKYIRYVLERQGWIEKRNSRMTGKRKGIGTRKNHLLGDGFESTENNRV